MKLIHIVSLMICLSILVVLPVCAYETYQDDLLGTGAYVSDNYYPGPGAGLNGGISTLEVGSIEFTEGASVYIHFDLVGIPSTYPAGALVSESTGFEAYDGATLVGTGIIGFQRLFDGGGTEQPGYQYLQFTSWDISGLAGNKQLDLVYDHAALNITSYRSGLPGAWTVSPPAGYMILTTFSAGNYYRAAGTSTFNRQFQFVNSYSATKGMGLGIVGSIWKYGLAGPPVYNSRAFVINASDNQIVTSEPSLGYTTLHFDVPTESIYIAVQDSLGNFHNSSTLFSVATAVPDQYSILVQPSTVTLPSTTTGTIIGDSSSALLYITDIDWSWADATGSYDFYEGGNTSRPMSYTKVGTTWWGYERGAGGIGGEYSRSKGTTFPNPVTLSNISSSGYKLVTCFIGTSDGYWYTLTAPLMVEQGGMQMFIVEATDAYSNALVGYTDISVLDKSSNLWSNVTASGGVYNFLLPYNANIYLEGVATGYLKSTKNWTILPYSSYIMKLPMYPTGTIAATNVSLNVVVLDGKTSGVFPNAQVRLSDGQVKSTSGAGVASFTVLAAKSYQIIASYTGYNSATRTLTTGTGGTSQDTYLTLNRIVVTTAPTLPPGVTAVVTLDTRTNAQKDLDMMNQIREYAPTLIMLAILMTMMYMVGYKP